MDDEKDEKSKVMLRLGALSDADALPMCWYLVEVSCREDNSERFHLRIFADSAEFAETVAKVHVSNRTAAPIQWLTIVAEEPVASKPRAP